MPHCDCCEESFDAGGEWIELRHHHAHMNFGSRFCSAECAATYLSNGLVDGLDEQPGV
jgi:hypothetical protein